MEVNPPRYEGAELSGRDGPSPAFLSALALVGHIDRPLGVPDSPIATGWSDCPGVRFLTKRRHGTPGVVAKPKIASFMPRRV